MFTACFFFLFRLDLRWPRQLMEEFSFEMKSIFLERCHCLILLTILEHFFFFPSLKLKKKKRKNAL